MIFFSCMDLALFFSSTLFCRPQLFCNFLLSSLKCRGLLLQLRFTAFNAVKCSMLEHIYKGWNYKVLYFLLKELTLGQLTVGMSGPSYPQKNENEINKRPTSPLKEISSPSHKPKCKEPRNRVVKSKAACKEPCNCARCRGRHIRRSDIVMNHMRRYPPKVGATWLKNSIIFPRPNQVLLISLFLI
jgi:hypothetical protein